MSEVYKPKFEMEPKSKSDGAVSKNVIDEELNKARTASREMLEDIKTGLSTNPEIADVEIKNMKKISLSYKGNAINYIAGAANGMDVVTINDKENSKNKNAGYEFNFDKTIFPTFTSETSEKNKADKIAKYSQNMIQRIELCIKSKDVITQKLDKDGMKLGDEGIFLMGKKLEEDKLYFSAEKLLKPGQEGYEEGKENTTGDMLYFKASNEKTENGPTTTKIEKLRDRNAFENRVMA